MTHQKADVVEHLRKEGHHDKADRAEKELPEHVDRNKDKGLLDKLGIDDSVLEKLPLDKLDGLPGGLGDKIKDAL
jgi:hypothetical protein